ncbi:uncharacterized protein PG986_004903 [Apiospora aurea]|uniref:Uncharacterized protein n=1 Tax=Apiospora aurea TaxID=335848 RepID=A0ABR1QG18_9PEZI
MCFGLFTRAKRYLAGRPSTRSQMESNRNSVATKTTGTTQDSSESSGLPSKRCVGREDDPASGRPGDTTHPDLDASSLRHEEPDQQQLGAESKDQASNTKEPTQAAAATNVSRPGPQNDAQPTENEEPKPLRLTQFSATRANRDIIDDGPPYGTKLYMVWARDAGLNEQQNRRIDEQLKTMVGPHRMYVSDTKFAGVNFWRAFLSMVQVELIRGMPEVGDERTQRAQAGIILVYMATY